MSAPRVSIVLLAYNQQPLIRQAVAGCLAQRGIELEIVCSDDASSDATFDEMATGLADYRGPHRVILNRNPVNLGIGLHLNRVVELASGELIIVAAGDDESLPERAMKVAAAWEASARRIDLIASNLLDMAPDGGVHGTIVVDDLVLWRSVDDWVRRRPFVIGAAQAFTRRVFEHFGGFSAGIAYEDQVMAFRAIVSGGAVTLADPLVKYRRGGTSMRTAMVSAEEIRDRLRVQNDRHLAELRQLHTDATRAGCLGVADTVLQPELKRQVYLQDLLQGRRWLDHWATFRRANSVAPSWRWRKFLTVAFAPAAAWIKRLKLRA
jgi:glycosyltransferase involved in cell wall biosynthesis